MALSSQESHCVNLVCQYLAKELEGTWTVESCLDDLYPEEPTPGVLVTNGRASAAIEVKRLTGDSIYQAYKQSLLSNQKFLAPSCGGYYTVSPPDDFRLPMALDLRRRVKREIECVAPILKPDETGVLRFPRKGRISLISESGPPYVTCSHYGPYSELLRPLMERVDGKLMLIDDKGFSHSFITEEGRNGFYDAVVGAWGRRLEGDATPFTWYEEWELCRLKDDDDDEEDEVDKHGVWIFAVTEARGMRESAAECVYAVLEKALSKFASKRWADHQVLVLEGSISAPGRLVFEVVSTLGPDEVPGVDLILLVDGDKIIPCYPMNP